jgi:hypothetical protein
VMQIETQVTKNKVFKTQILKTYLTLKKKVHEYTSTDWPFPMNWSTNKPQPFLLYLTIFTCNKTPMLVDRFTHSNLHSQLGQHSLSTSKPFNPIHGHRTSSSHPTRPPSSLVLHKSRLTKLELALKPDDPG